MGRIGLAFLVGVCCVHTLGALPDAAWAVALAVAIALSAVARSWLICALLVGVAWGWGAAAARLAGDLPAALEGEDIQVRGYVASLPDIRRTDPQFLLDVVAGPQGTPSRMRLTWYRAAAVPYPGELWRLTVRLKRRSGFANPGGFDYEGHLFHQGVGATGYVRDDEQNVRLAMSGLRYPATQVRAWLAQRLADAVGGHSMLGVIQGLAIGETQAMSPEQWRVFAATGTTHLMAISGLHIGMVAALMAWLGGNIIRYRRAQALGWSALHGQVIAGSCTALAYATLAGLSIPTQRTLIMLCIYFTARWLRRELAVSHALGLAVIGVLLVDPFAPLSAGAWLSFGAVAVILLAISGRLTRDGAVMNFTRVQAALSIGLTPFLLGAFGSLSLISPLANALAVPLFTLAIVPTVLLGALGAAIWLPAGELILRIPLLLLELSWPVLEWLARQPLAVWHPPQPSAPTFIALVIGAALLMMPGLWVTRATGALLCLPIVLSRPATPAPGDFELATLDVGQGLANVVRTHSHVLVYDAGPAFRSGRDTGELVLAPYLRHRGVRRVDMLMVSHGDLDHQGGVRSLLAALPVNSILQGPSVDAVEGAPCVRGQKWVWDAVTFEVLHPSAGDDGRDNDSSCVLRIEGRGGAVLLTGDVEAAAEEQLLSSGLKPVDLVVAPHHGSRTSSTTAFVEALQPQVVVFSSGYRNRWGFPKSDVVERWTTPGAQQFTTADSGAVEVLIESGQPLHVREYRRTHARYWRR